MKSGEKQVDVTQEVWIAIEEEDEPALKEMVSRFGTCSAKRRSTWNAQGAPLSLSLLRR
jgi:hypothetical protein